MTDVKNKPYQPLKLVKVLTDTEREFLSASGNDVYIAFKSACAFIEANMRYLSNGYVRAKPGHKVIPPKQRVTPL